MDCFHQTNEQKKFCSVLQNQREATAEKTDESKEKQKCLIFPFSNAALSMSPPDIGTMQSRETANHTDPTQAGDEHSTQKKCKVHEWKMKKSK